MAGTYPVPGYTHLATARPQGGPAQLGLGAIDVQDVSARLLGILNTVGATLGKTVVIFSGYRTDAYSQSVGGFAGDPHSRRIATDATIDGQPIGNYPGAVALIHSLGARSGATDFSYGGKPDPSHVDLVGGTGSTVASSGGDSTSVRDFLSGVLRKVGAPVNDKNLSLLGAIARAEGTAAKNNPLATTQAASGASSFNSAGVKNYPDEQTGVTATATTLLSGRYPTLITSLRSGKGVDGINNAKGISELNLWATGTPSAAPSAYSRGILLMAGPQSSATLDWIGKVVTAPVKAAKAAADAALAVPEFLAKLADTHNILRGLQVVAGAVLVLVGVVLLARQVGLAADVPSPSALPVPVPVP